LRATRIGSGAFRAGILPLSRQQPQKPVRQVVEVMQPVAQIGVRHRLHPRARRGLFLFHRRLGRQPARDVLLHPAHPAAGAGEHPVGLQHLALLGIARGDARQHLVHVDPQPFHRLLQALQLHLRVVGHGPRDHHARLVQPDMAHCRAFLRAAAAKHLLRRVACPQGRALAGEGAKLRHLGHDHRHDFQRVDLVAGNSRSSFDCTTSTPSRSPSRMIGTPRKDEYRLLPRLWHVAKAALSGRIGGVHGAGRARDPAHQALADAHACHMDGLGRKTLGGAQFQRVGIAQQVDRAHFRAHRIGDQMRDAVQPLLPLDRFGHDRLQARQKLAAFAFALLDHRPLMPVRPFWAPVFRRPSRAPDTRNRHTARLQRGATFNRRPSGPSGRSG
jgi:hypothetical protein